MEEAVIKLVKVVAAQMKALYQYGADAESVVDKILNTAEIAVHQYSKEELTEYFKTLN